MAREGADASRDKNTQVKVWHGSPSCRPTTPQREISVSQAARVMLLQAQPEELKLHWPQGPLPKALEMHCIVRR
jgi:hypothetical protein